MSEFKRILLVEDDRTDTELTLSALASHNLANDVVALEDGAQAMDYLRCRGPYAGRHPENPAVIILDLKMPKMDGLEVLRAVRSEDKLRLIPVVMLTSSAEERDMIESYRLGANGYVVKPLDFKAFMTAVSALGVFWAAVNQAPPSFSAR